MRRFLLAALLAALGVIAIAPAARAEIPSVFDGEVACGEVTAAGNVSGSEGQTWCGSILAADQVTSTVSPALSSVSATAETFDGMPIDVNVAFPDDGSEAPYPLVMVFHGYGGMRIPFRSMQRWLKRGYAVFTMTDRGFWQSCGQAPSTGDPACEDQYVRLMDTRYEVRDAQYFASVLADEGLVVPDRIAATGGSYGGGMSMALAALKDRTMLPDGTLVPWESPGGTPMSLAVATPNIPWTDLAYSLVPNGNTLDYVEDNPYTGRFGVKKDSYVNLLYAGGFATGRYAPEGTQPANDLTGWKAQLDLGEPYDTNPVAQDMLEEITTYHSSYYIDHSRSPAPMLISSGFTDDLFPADEATRFYNRTRARYPSSPLALFFGSFGHSRGQGKSDTVAALNALENRWIDHYLADQGPQPPSDVTAFTQTCPDPAPTVDYNAADWASISPGEVRVEGGPEVQTVEPNGGDPAVGQKFGATACTTAAGAKEPGTANYELRVPDGGFTMVGSPTVIARIEQAGANSQIAARLVDVGTDGQKTLIARGLWRPEPAPASRGFQVFQLHANGWRFEAGHTLRLELLPDDASYGRPSNGQQQAKVSFVDLRIPVVEEPGSAGGLVEAPAPKVLPDRPGAALAPGYEAIGSIGIVAYADQADPVPPPPGVCPPGTVGTPPSCAVVDPAALPRVTGKVRIRGKAAKVSLTCPGGVMTCFDSRIEIRGLGKKRNRVLIARKARVNVPGASVPLTAKGRKLFKDRKVRVRGKVRTRRGLKKLKVRVVLTAGQSRSATTTTARRVGRVR